MEKSGDFFFLSVTSLLPLLLWGPVCCGNAAASSNLTSVFSPAKLSPNPSPFFTKLHSTPQKKVALRLPSFSRLANFPIRQPLKNLKFHRKFTTFLAHHQIINYFCTINLKFQSHDKLQKIDSGRCGHDISVDS